MGALRGSTPLVKCMLLMDSDGRRVAVKYYDPEWNANLSIQENFEKAVHRKTCRTNARGDPEIIMFDGVITVYKTTGDCCFYVVGDPDENELILGAALQAFYESISMLLAMVEKKTVLENLDLVLICMDEIVDSGIILETNSDLIASRVTMRVGGGGGGQLHRADVPAGLLTGSGPADAEPPAVTGRSGVDGPAKNCSKY